MGASRLKRFRLSFLDPMDVVDVDKDLIGRAREAVGEFKEDNILDLWTWLKVTVNSREGLP